MCIIIKQSTKHYCIQELTPVVFRKILDSFYTASIGSQYGDEGQVVTSPQCSSTERSDGVDYVGMWPLPLPQYEQF